MIECLINKQWHNFCLFFSYRITSCTSTVQVVLSTTIPLLLVLFVLIMIVAYRIYKNRKRKNDILWSQFVSNDALRTYTMINQLTFDNNEEVIPVFIITETPCCFIFSRACLRKIFHPEKKLSCCFCLLLEIGILNFFNYLRLLFESRDFRLIMF